MMESYILHLPKWFPNDDDNLEGVFVRRHIQCSSYKYRAKLIYLKSSSRIIPKSFYIVENIKHDFGDYYLIYYKKNYVGLESIDKLIKLFVYYYLLLKYCNRIIRLNGKPHAIHVHVLLRSAIVALYYKLFYSIPYFITEHNTIFTNSQKLLPNNLKHQLRKYVVVKAKGIIAVSDNLKWGMLNYKLQNTNYNVIYNNVDTSVFCNAPKRPSVVLKCLHVSEFKNDHKNIIGILNVIKELKMQGFPVFLDLVGYGQDCQMILDFIKGNELDSHIRYLGKLLPNALAKCYQAADVFVLFSNKENMPCVIAESLCCGTPVISTHVGGIQEVVHSGNGILIEAGNQLSLKKAMEDFYLNRHQYHADIISDEAISKFCDQAIGAKITKCYDTLTACG